MHRSRTDEAHHGNRIVAGLTLERGEVDRASIERTGDGKFVPAITFSNPSTAHGFIANGIGASNQLTVGIIRERGSFSGGILEWRVE